MAKCDREHLQVEGDMHHRFSGGGRSCCSLTARSAAIWGTSILAEACWHAAQILTMHRHAGNSDAVTDAVVQTTEHAHSVG